MDEEFWNNLTRNILERSVLPELNRRQQAGLLPNDFSLYAAQVVMEVGTQAQIRLNEEVQAAIGIDPARVDDFNSDVPIQDFAAVAPHIKSFDLADDDRPNAAHLTMIRNGPGWFITFDFRYNGARIRDHLRNAKEFLDVATLSLKAEALRGFALNAATAVELLARARLLIHPDERMLTSNKHRFTVAEFSRYAKMGNVDVRFAKMLTRLNSLRDGSRYPNKIFGLESAEAQQILELAHEMFADVLAAAPNRSKRDLG